MPMPPDEKKQKPAVLVAFGAAVRYYRKEKGLSQEAFADQCGIDRSYMGGIERGERNVALLNIARIAQTLGLELSVFFAALDAYNPTSDNSPAKPRR